MAVRYSNAAATATFTGDSRAAIANGLKDALVACGWSVVSGSSGDWKLNSGTTPAGHQIRVRVWDPGSGNCAQVRIMNVSETIAPAQSAFLLPASGRAFRVLGCPYQFFCFVPGSVEARSFCVAGIPYRPSFLPAVANIAWLLSSGSDTTTSLPVPTIRTSNTGPTQDGVPVVIIYGNGGWYSSSLGAGQWTISNCLLEAKGNNGRSYKWDDDSLMLWEPLVAFGRTSINDPGFVQGQLWDAILVRERLPLDQTFSYDGKTWWSFYYGTGGFDVTLAILYPTS